jgi:Fe-S-cluster-containing dehydrogenase component
VLIELASRLKFPAFTREDGTRKFKDYPDFVVNFQPQPGVGFLMGWRGKDGTEHLRGEPNPKQWEMYAKNNCVFQYHMPETMQYMRNWNQPYLDFAKDKGWRQRNDPVQLALYSDTLQSFRLAAQGKTRAASRPSTCASASPPTSTRCRSGTRRWRSLHRPDRYPLNAITQRPMAMYHSWDSQNAWLRQIHSHNYLHVNPLTAQAAGIADGGWCWVESAWGEVRCMLRYSDAVEPGTVWTWNAIGKADGAWQLAPGADESRKGFLLNHLISEELPFAGQRRTTSATPTRSPARPAGTTCGCASARRRPTRTRRKPSPRLPPCRARPACSAVRLFRNGHHAGSRTSFPGKACPGSPTSSRAARRNTGQAAGAGHRPERLRRLPCLRHLLQAVEHLRRGRPAGGPERLRRRPTGTFFNRVQTYEAGSFPNTETIHFPKSCLHCEDPPCVPVCPTGASYKRKEDGIVLVDYDKCIGCKYCAWACPYGAREFDEERQVMTKCTLCVDRIYDELLPPQDRKPACVKACPTGARLFGDVKDPDSEVSQAIRERGGYALMPEWETQPANQYLPRQAEFPAPIS